MITTRERIRISELVRGAFATAGTPLDTLMQEFAPIEGRHALYASQGKTAFEQIVVAAGLQGSRIILPAFFPDDFVGVFLKYGITPVFVDVDPTTYHLDLGAVTQAHLVDARALLIEHTFGLPANGALYRSFCDKHGLVLIEDCARALGASFKGKLVGADGHYAMFSLPKCVPVRAGGLALSETPMHATLGKARIGISGLLHALTLVKYPFANGIEGLAYSLLADSSIYPREVGNYDPQPAREFDVLGRFMLKAFLPLYRGALAKKRACAEVLRTALEPMGFMFQSDGDGEHICTSLAAEPPSRCDADQLKAFLIAHGVKASAMWRSALGISAFGRSTWGAAPQTTPVALRLSQRLIQLPVSRFRTASQTAQIIALCRRYVADTAASGDPHMCLAPGRQ